MEKNTERKSLLVHLDKRETLEMLDDTQAGQLFKMLIRYADDGVVGEAEDQVVRIVFSMMRQQMDHDAQRYAETCQKRAENGRKGGRPKGSSEKANGFLAFEKKAKESKGKQTKAKKPDTDTDTDTDTVTVCDCVTPRVRAREDTHAHTPASLPDASQIISLAKSTGYVWDEAEAEAFLAYNRDRDRTDGWEFAVRKWEEHRATHKKHRRKAPAEDALAAGYLSLVNRFPKEET